MNTPPFLVGATLLFWGWESGLLWLGIILAGLLEGARWSRMRWDFSQADLDRIWNLCQLLFVASLVLVLTSNDGLGTMTKLARSNSFSARAELLNQGARSLISIFVWLPLTLAPIVIAQAFSRQERMDWSTFSRWLRRQRDRRPPALPGSGLNFAYPYFAACLLGASAANDRTVRFSIGIGLLVAWALWPRKIRAAKVWVWAGCVALILVLGVLAQTGLREAQRLMRRLDSALISRLASSRTVEARESRTSIGAVGQLKLSGQILLRVETDGQAPPALLREASYKYFRPPIWGAPRQDFSTLISETNLTTWNLLEDKATRRSAVVSCYLSGGTGLLPVPQGVARLEDLLAGVLKTNRLGTLRFEEGPGFVRYQTHYDEGRSIDTDPDRDDLDVPVGEDAALSRVVDELGLKTQSPEQALVTLHHFFAEHFHYSTWQRRDRRPSVTETALGAFLLRNRTGHCEYFATATVLLLRKAGIYARYATGYAVQEKKGRFWVIRGRHGHAWCLAWIKGAWREVDNTPASWVEMENSSASPWEAISDFASRLWFEFSKWRWGKGEWKQYLIWLAVPLVGWTAWRLFARKQWTRAQARSPAKVTRQTWPGLDSEFYKIMSALANPALPRAPGENLSVWLARVAQTSSLDPASLKNLLLLHYRLRFDPTGLSTAERALLKNDAAQVAESLIQLTRARP